MESYIKTGVKMYLYSLLTVFELSLLVVGVMMLFYNFNFISVLMLSFTPLGLLASFIATTLGMAITDDGSDFKESLVMYSITIIFGILTGRVLAVLVACLVAYVLCYHVVKYKGKVGRSEKEIFADMLKKQSCFVYGAVNWCIKKEGSNYYKTYIKYTDRVGTIYMKEEEVDMFLKELNEVARNETTV